MNNKKIGFIIAIAVVAIFSIMYITNQENSQKDILGTYRNQENSFNTIFFDTSSGEYVEYEYNPTTTQTLKNSGEFLQENGKIEFLSGKYADFKIKFENNILILYNNENNIKFDKINDVPTVIN